MAYYRIPVPTKGFPPKQLREIKKAMRDWEHFFAVFHDQQHDVVPVSQRTKSRYWMEISDQPIKAKNTRWNDADMQRHIDYIRRTR